METTYGVGARDKRASLKYMIAEVAIANGINPRAFLRMAEIESDFDPDSFHHQSKAAGLFQFIPSTAKQFQLENPFDPAASAKAAAKLWNENRKILQAGLGRVPTDGEVYLAHQQGAYGAIRLLLHSDQLASSLVGRKAVLQNGGRETMTAREFAELWTKRFD